ncbi:GGDEF and EAL domain-containing protein [Beduini massiliensis]|uniref:GGDEF and EAL domain-containing protein n=1 Tax=Beduini massiliensis TaxID=1585974 RepID=UPI00164DDAF4|nr:GGDEF and EAL domain-containing protein [Beduini massiliensis]
MISLDWNIAPECISAVILSIIWLYSRRGSWLPTLRNRIFQCCFLVTFLAIITNILSTIMIAYYHVFPLWLIWLITTIYFIFTPLMGAVYCLYAATIIYQNKEHLLRFMKLSMIPAVLYTLLVLTNPFNKELFDLNYQSGYVKGPWIAITYILFYAYCLGSLIIAYLKRDKVDKNVFNILSAFPIIASVVIAVQQIFPTIILTGSAATCALLIIYLYLQNKQISMDYLTDIPNQLELSNMLEYLLSEYPKQHFSLFVISLRDFTQINSAFTHQVGDGFLKTIASYLASLVGQQHVYRFKGDEFAILIRQPHEVIAVILKQIQERMQKPWVVKEHEAILSYVIGAVDYPESTTGIESLISSVEYAVSAAKKNYNGYVCYCDQNMFEMIQRKREIVKILKDKIASQDFEMYYQPIFSVTTQQYEYAESLVRINDSPLGPILPSEFIPIAEETGLIIEMTYMILDKVCQFARRLIDEQITIKCIHVNFSAIQFRQPHLAQKVCEIIHKNNIPFSVIKIEFTESTLAENMDIIHDFVSNMEKMGIYMGLDDFGVGYSNISTVIQIPFTTIKLDKSLVWAASKQEKSAIMVKNLIRTFKDLNLTVVAEGVEDDFQNQFMIRNGVDQIQGYYYSKPLSKKDMIRFMKEHNPSITKG